MHEHMDNFSYINMNGRIYDPITMMFMSPDPYLQQPGNWLNYNRYSYCLNNPFKYTDPSGEFISTIFGFAKDVIANTFVKPWSQGINAWTDSDNWRSTVMGLKIDYGLVYTDKNKWPLGQAWELISRFSWQLPSTAAGYLYATGANTTGNVTNVSHGYGVTAIATRGNSETAVTIGNYTVGPKGYRADWRDHLFVHEYGHYIQSQQWGPLYLPIIGIGSLQSVTAQQSTNGGVSHHDRWFEADASYKGMKYFDKHYGSGKSGYKQKSPNYFDKNSFIKGGYSPYNNLRTNNNFQRDYSVRSKFHWTDITIHIPGLGFLAH